MVKEYITSLRNHTRIDFVALRETPKAVLMKIKSVESDHVRDLLNYYGADLMEPLQVWIPKGWLRMSNRNGNDDVWIWKYGLMQNLEKLATKRLAKKFDSNIKKPPKGVTIH